MAKKKADLEVKENEAVEVTDHTYEEIHNNTLEKLAEPVEEKVEKVDEKPEDKPNEDEEKKVEDVEEEVEFDPEKLKEEAAEIARQKIWEEAEKRQREAEEAMKRQELEADENTPPWIKRGENTPKDYDELTNWNVEQAKKAVAAEWEKREAEKQARLDEEKQAEETRKKTEEDATNEWNKMVDEQLEDLYRNNKLPKIKNKADDNDEGLRARKALFQTMYEVNEKLKKEGKRPVTSIKEIFYEHYKAPTTQPPGADAPIAGSRLQNATAKVDGEYTYAEIHNARDYRSLYK